jgi:hypothetical protein
MIKHSALPTPAAITASLSAQAELCWCCHLPPLSCRNNTSDYYVDSKRMNVKEVTTLLKAKGIDLDNNRFLILQVRWHELCSISCLLIVMWLCSALCLV